MDHHGSNVTQITGYDAIIVGARVAGSATALLLARAGLRVLVLDREAPGADTLSTHAIMRPGVLQLHRWGLLDRVLADGAPPIRTTTFHYGDESIPIPIRNRDGVDCLLAPRRTSLDPILVDAAREAGAEVRYGVQLIGLTRGRGGRVTGVVARTPEHHALEIPARWVIGADGLQSTVAQLVRAPVLQEGSYASATIYTYFQGLPNGGFHWFYRPGVAAGVIPTNGGRTCVFVSTPTRRFREILRFDLADSFRRVLTEVAPRFTARVEAAGREGSFRGFAGRVGHLRQAWGPGWALVGDAGYFKDPCTAHGLTDALRDAELLARAIGSGHESSLHSYETTRDMLSARFFAATERVASFGWDLEALKEHHRVMSDAMKTEVAALVALDEVVRHRAHA